MYWTVSCHHRTTTGSGAPSWPAASLLSTSWSMPFIISSPSCKSLDWPAPFCTLDTPWSWLWSFSYSLVGIKETSEGWQLVYFFHPADIEMCIFSILRHNWLLCLFLVCYQDLQCSQSWLKDPNTTDCIGLKVASSHQHLETINIHLNWTEHHHLHLLILSETTLAPTDDQFLCFVCLGCSCVSMCTLGCIFVQTVICHVLFF